MPEEPRDQGPLSKRALAWIAGVVGVAVVGGWALTLSQAIPDWVDETIFWAVVAALLAVAVGVLAWRLYARRPTTQIVPATGSGDPRVEVKPPRGTRLIGIAVGRMHTSYGLLTVTGETVGPVPEQGQLGEAKGQGKVDVDITRGNFAPLYAALAPRIGELLKLEEEIDGIGVGVPGQVNPVRGAMLEGPGGGMGELFAQYLADALCNERCDLSRLRVDAPPTSSAAKRAVMERILLDNDARCAVRILQSEVLSDPHWRNYVYVHVGGGVGTGIVLEKVIYYGARGTSGESGHMTLDLAADHALERPKDEHWPLSPDPAGGHRIPKGDDPVLLRDGLDAELVPEYCRCGHAGVHWEALAEGRGLMSLARQIDEQRAETLARAAGRDGAPHLTARDVGVAIAHIDGTHRERSVPDKMVEALADREMREYVQGVVRVYARFLAVGLANLANILNLDHIVLGGGVMDGLYPVPTFHDELDACMKRYTMHTCHQAVGIPERRERMHYDYDNDAPGMSWQGAALVFQDASYATFRERLK